MHKKSINGAPERLDLRTACSGPLLRRYRPQIVSSGSSVAIQRLPPNRY